MKAPTTNNSTLLIALTPTQRSERQAVMDRLSHAEHPDCVMCGPGHPNGLRLKFKVEPDGAVKAMVNCHSNVLSYKDVVHGGIISALLDEAMVTCLFSYGVISVTATLEVKYNAPTVPERFAVLRAWMESDKAYPLYNMRADLVQDGRRVAEATAKFIIRET